ncbi:hypothetical protein [Cellulomonas sp. PSBB021]|uniref:hypothetical protein n=1 Tax=Cellulomonas sp. PSBB021 TaxID=2003551 RepID=UPI001E5CDE34|nr:hypothetical protein [Cellulomonas sp. PSBB021]
MQPEPVEQARAALTGVGVLHDERAAVLAGLVRERELELVDVGDPPLVDLVHVAVEPHGQGVVAAPRDDDARAVRRVRGRAHP